MSNNEYDKKKAKEFLNRLMESDNQLQEARLERKDIYADAKLEGISKKTLEQAHQFAKMNASKLRAHRDQEEDTRAFCEAAGIQLDLPMDNED